MEDRQAQWYEGYMLFLLILTLRYMKLFIMEKVNIIYIMYSCEDLEDDSLFVL